MLVSPSSVRLGVVHPGSAQPARFADGHNSAMVLGSASYHPGGNRHGHQRGTGTDDRRGQGLLLCCGLAAPIELKTEGLAKGGQRPFGGVGFGRLERDIVHLAGGCSAAFAGAMAFPDDGRAICLHSDPHPGDIDRQEGAPVLPGKDAFGFDGLPVPAVKPEDPVGLRDGVPALEIGEFAAMGLSGADIAMIGLAPQRADLLC